MNIVGLHGAIGWNPLNYIELNKQYKQYDHWLHDSGCAIVKNGEFVGSILEERVSRQKYDGRFPVNSINYCLKLSNLKNIDIDLVILSTNCVHLFNENLESRLIHNLILTFFPNANIRIIDHHLCHAASAVFTSNFSESDILTIDGAGSTINLPEYDVANNFNLGYFSETKSKLRLYYAQIGERLNNFGTWYSLSSIETLRKKRQEMGIPNMDFVLDREGAPGKVMGLSAYSNKNKEYEKFLSEAIKNRFMAEHQIEATTLKYYDSPLAHHFFKLTGRPDQILANFLLPPSFSAEDSAAYLQFGFNMSMLLFIYGAYQNQFLENNVCFAGGTFLNVIANSIIRKTGLFNQIHIPPYTSDCGLAIGAALYGAWMNKIKTKFPKNIALLGKQYTKEEIYSALFESGVEFEYYEDFKELCNITAKKIDDNKIVAWFQGRSECGPRALGSRSILMSPKHSSNKDLLNLRVKHREYWRPFAGAILRDYVTDYFEEDWDSPYMLYSFTTKFNVRDDIPAINHVDNSCRVQTITEELFPEFYDLLTSVHKVSGIPIVLNTSFNDNGEPIVESPKDAIEAFLKMDIDMLVIGNYIVRKNV